MIPVPLKAAGWPSTSAPDTHTGAFLSPRGPGVMQAKAAPHSASSPRAAAVLTGGETSSQTLPRPRQTLQGGDLLS